jgi:hypothetical protein
MNTEDDIAIDTVVNYLDEKECSPRALETTLTGFMGEQGALTFVKEMWVLLAR